MHRYIVAQCRNVAESPEPCIAVESPASRLHHPELKQFFRAFDAEVQCRVRSHCRVRNNDT